MAYITGRAESTLRKFLRIFLLFLLVAGAGTGYLYFHPDIWKSWVKGTPLEQAPTITRVYKWQDKNGAWQMTDQPPTGGVKYQTLIYSSNSNLVPSLPTEEKNSD